MPEPTTPGALFRAESQKPTPPPEPSLDDALAETATVIDLNSLLSAAQVPTHLSNLRYASSVASTNLAAQNGLANQQSLNHLRTAVLGRVVQAVSNTGPLEGRSSTDVLTDNDLADAITALEAVLSAFGPITPTPPGPPAKVLLALMQKLITILRSFTQDAKLGGKGTINDPFVTDGILYFTAPITIGFAGLKPEQVSLHLEGQRVVATNS